MSGRVGHTPLACPFLSLHLQATPSGRAVSKGAPATRVGGASGGRGSFEVAGRTRRETWTHRRRCPARIVARLQFRLVIFLPLAKGERMFPSEATRAVLPPTGRQPRPFRGVRRGRSSRKVPPRRTTQGVASGGMAARSLVGEGPPCAFPSGRCTGQRMPYRETFAKKGGAGLPHRPRSGS